MSGITAKIITAAAVAAIAMGAVLTYKYVIRAEQKPHLPQQQITVHKHKEPGDNNHQQVHFAKNDSAIQPKQLTDPTVVEGAPVRTEAKTGVSGIIIDKSSSRPIKGAEVFYGPRKKPQGFSFTDANGHFELLDVKQQGWQNFYIVAKNYTSRQISLEIIKDKVYENFKVELTAGSKVAGIVYDPNGKPVKAATLATFQFTNHPVVTDANGTFEIDGLDPAWGQYYIHATHPNYPAFSTSFSPANAGQTVWQDVVLKPGVTVHGQVTDPKGDPIANVNVGNTASRAMWNCISTKTDREGKYELKNVDVGELVLWAVINKSALYVERFSLDGSEAKKLINIPLKEPLPLQGKIVDQQGNPVSGVSVAVSEYKGVRNLVGWQDRVTSDSSGKFLIPNASSEGTVKLSVVAEGISSIEPELEIGQEKEYIIEVDRAGKIYGKVVDDRTDEPIRRFNVKLTFGTKGYQPGWGYSATWSREGHNFDSAEGFFDTGRENIPIGAEYSITVYADGFDPCTIDPVIVQPTSNDPNRTEFRLKPATAIAGRVVDSNSIPIAGARVRILFDNTDSEHWDDRDTTVTNSSGEFILRGAGSQQRCIYVTAETFTPYAGSTPDLPKNSEGTVEITLKRGAVIFGRVSDANGQGIANAKVSQFMFPEPLHKCLRSQWQTLNLKQTDTDIDGYYELFDLPEGSFTVSVDASTADGNLITAQKKTAVKAGECVELDFGNEAGFTVKGVVRTGEKLLEKASVEIRLSDNSTKGSHTNNKGRFQIEGIPEGIYEVSTNYYSAFDSRMSRAEPQQQLHDRRQVAVDSSLELDIDLGAGAVSGKIPEQFEGLDKLQITCRRWTPQISSSDTLRQNNWQSAGLCRIQADGCFECSNLRTGQYYLALRTEFQEILAISDVFELSESEHLENITFDVGSGTLQIHVVDADTLYAIPSATFTIKNELGAVFYSRKLTVEDRTSLMVADDKGTVEYSGLPKGRYTVWVWTPGYLTTQSDWVNLSNGEIRKITVPVERAAMVNFEISEELKKRITANTAYLRCRIKNADTDELVPPVGPYGKDQEYTVLLLPEEYAAQRQAAINLPEGTYEITYRLYQDKEGLLRYETQSALLQETVNIQIRKGQTTLITVLP